MKQKIHIGTTITSEVVIEQGMLQRFIDALDVHDPLSVDAHAAKNAGLSNLMLPSTAVATLIDVQPFIELLELKPKQVLHARETVQLLAPVCVQEQLKITTVLRDLQEQSTGTNPMGFVTLETMGATKEGIKFVVTRVLAIRGGFPRR